VNTATVTYFELLRSFYGEIEQMSTQSTPTPNRITCPDCGCEIDVSTILSEQLRSEIKTEYDAKLAADRKGLKERETAIQAAEVEVEKAGEEVQATIKLAVASKVQEEKKTIEEAAKKKAEAEQADAMKSLQGELDEQSKKVRELNTTKAALTKVKREKDQLKEELEEENEVKLTKAIAEQTAKIKKTAEDNAELTIKEKDLKIEELATQIGVLKKKAEQGSVQAQGEAQEIAIEEYLEASFPMDTIQEIKKGAQGGDTLQIVNEVGRPKCGIIYYESKRAKNWSEGWIAKFKSDILDAKADVGVLVTEVMPADMHRMGLRDGVWVCSLEEFKGICHVLRDGIVKFARALATEENKGDKMEMLYVYLTGNEFRGQVEAIVQAFIEMQDALQKEKRSHTTMWKKREKSLEKVILNTAGMHGSITGIAGGEIQRIAELETNDDETKQLEAPDDEESQDAE